MRLSIVRYRLTLLVLIILLQASRATAAAESVLVATASNMGNAMQELADGFQKQTGTGVRIVSGSSGNFTRQILQGAPFDLFMSASKAYLDTLRDAGVSIPRSTELARGRIGFYIPAASPLGDRRTLDEILNAVKFNEYRLIAYANPEFAPYGVAARQALEKAGVWVMDINKQLIGENAAQAVQFCLTGSVDMCIIPLSYAKLPEVQKMGRFFLVPADWHEPLRQYIILLNEKNSSAAGFYDFLLGEQASQVLVNYGYDPAGNP